MALHNSQRPSRVLLLSHARTASHLLEKMLSGQPNVEYTSHPFALARTQQLKALESGPWTKVDQAEKNSLYQAWQDGYAIWEEFFANAARTGKIGFLHCHPHFMLQPALMTAYVHGDHITGPSWVAHSMHGVDDSISPDNPSVLPDAALLTPGTVPIFTIRNPVAMIPSIYRTINEVGQGSWESTLFSSTLRWQRQLFDWFVEHGETHGIKPIIVDADNYQGPHRKAYMSHLCEITGLDPDSVIYKWQKVGEKELSEMPPLVATIKKTILGSDGVIDGLDAASLNVASVQADWEKQYGKKGMEQIRDLIKRTQSDYDYLKARKLSI